MKITWMMRNFCTALFFVLSFILHGQQTVKGKVVDMATAEPLAFANITFNNNPKLTTTSDIDGFFTFTSETRLEVLKCSHIGYNQTTLVLKQRPIPLLIELTTANDALQEVVVRTGENPAKRIIRKVIANKNANNPENISSFQYRSYNKITYDLKPNGKSEDSTEIAKIFQGMHLFIMESVTERKYVRPNLSEETITATRVSGFKNPQFASLATDFQPFSFYSNSIRLFDIQYLNPISDGSLTKYDFTIEDIHERGQDSVYVISYKPLPGKNFDGLTGLLYINTNKYAVQNVIAAPAVSQKIDIKIQQQYQYHLGFWFPEQLNYTLVLNQFPDKNVGMVLNGRSYIDSVQLNVPIRKKDFKLQSVLIHDDATTRDSIFWQRNRHEAMTVSEYKTYHFVDSLGHENNFDYLSAILGKLSRGRLPIGIVDLDLTKTLLYNKYEGLRLGTGFFTNEKFSKKLILGGFFGYGLRDQEWKYGGSVDFMISENNDWLVGARYQNNLIEVGGYGLRNYYPAIFDYRRMIAQRFDQLEQFTVQTGLRTGRYLTWHISGNSTRTTPLYESAASVSGVNLLQFQNTHIDVNLRFAFGEKIIQSFGQNMVIESPYPVLFMSYSRGLKDLFDGEIEFNKIELRLEHAFHTANLGSTRYRLQAGFIDRAVPYGLMFTGEGAYDGEVPFIMRNTFQTMLPYEFVSDRYADLFLSHDFGGLLFKTGKFQPGISWHNNIGWGDLVNSPAGMPYQTKEKLFTETGLVLDHLLKLNYMNIGSIGIGVGGFLRYGNYAYTDLSDNVVFKLSLAFSIK